MNAKRNRGLITFILATAAGWAMAWAVMAQIGTAPDATGGGPLAVRSAEYRGEAGVNPIILGGRATEIWGQLYHPVDLSRSPYPVIVFLHGNHGTCGTGSNPRVDSSCQYTTTGTCPPGYVVAPSHLGYSYLATKLASWGYIVASINANRGITCGGGVAGDGGLNLARGRLVLEHLATLAYWNYFGDAPASLGLGPDGLLGTMDLYNIGLMGHSRGGEGVRAAYNQYRDAGSLWPERIVGGVNITAIFEIGAVDGQTSRVLNADGIAWNQLLPMCDGDVSNLQGVRPFDRMMNLFDENPPTPKSTYTVWGANHNYYNTEWQTSDSSGCVGHTPLWTGSVGSATQRTTAEASLLAFFRANVVSYIGGYDPSLNQNFNPQYALPAVVTSVTRVDRGFTDSPNSTVTTRFEDFTGATGTSSFGIPNDAVGLTAYTHGGVPNHAPSLRAAALAWNAAGGYFQTHWTATGAGRDITAYLTLDLRLSRQSSALNPAGPTHFSIALVHADGSLTGAVSLRDYTDLRGPVGGLQGGLHPILQTARIYLYDFAGIDPTQVRGVRLTFDDTPSGAIYVANLRLSSFYGSGAISRVENRDYPVVDNTPGPEDTPALNVITGIHRVGAAKALDDNHGVEIELLSNRPFPVRDELVILKVGEEEFELSRYPESGDLNVLTFTLTADQFDRIATGERVTVQYGRGRGTDHWDFGWLDKGRLKR